MISARRVKLMSVALLLSGGTVVLTQQWLKGAVRQAAVEAQAQAPSRATPTIRILVAAQPLQAGAVLKAQSVRWQDWPAGASTSGYLTDGAVQPDQLAGAILRTAVDAGEPITAGRIALPGDRGAMATMLQPGDRAVTVGVTASSGVAGFVSPGDRVDLILTRNLNGANGSQAAYVSETVLTNLRVLGMDQRAEDPKDPKKDLAVPQTATLEVTPKGAEVIALATELGKLSLSLRSLADVTAPEPKTTVTRTASVEGGPPGLRARAAHAERRLAQAGPTPAGVQIVRGGAEK